MIADQVGQGGHERRHRYRVAAHASDHHADAGHGEPQDRRHAAVLGVGQDERRLHRIDHRRHLDRHRRDRVDERALYRRADRRELSGHRDQVGEGGHGARSRSRTPPTLQSIAITPSSATVNTGATQQFSVSGKMSDGSSVSITNATWTATGGTVSSSGLYTAGGTAGSFSVQVTASAGALSASAGVTVVTPAPPPPPPPTGGGNEPAGFSRIAEIAFNAMPTGLALVVLRAGRARGLLVLHGRARLDPAGRLGAQESERGVSIRMAGGHDRLGRATASSASGRARAEISTRRCTKPAGSRFRSPDLELPQTRRWDEAARILERGSGGVDRPGRQPDRGLHQRQRSPVVLHARHTPAEPGRAGHVPEREWRRH